MARLPISFQKIKTKDYQNIDTVKYLVIVSEKGSYFDKTALCDRAELIKLRDELDKDLANNNTAEILKVSEDQATTIDSVHKSDKLCKIVNLKCHIIV